MMWRDTGKITRINIAGSPWHLTDPGPACYVLQWHDGSYVTLEFWCPVGDSIHPEKWGKVDDISKASRFTAEAAAARSVAYDRLHSIGDPLFDLVDCTQEVERISIRAVYIGEYDPRQVPLLQVPHG